MAIAIGYRRREAEAYGVDFSKRGSRTDEFLEIVTRLWAGETLTFEGRHFNIKGARVAQTPARGRIPLYVGGFNDKDRKSVVSGKSVDERVDLGGRRYIK